ncbi:MAG TPA: DUF333 domain-containing protein [Candidatus Nanoarchaeia archaeon]|nr:DUF333 domain-containing protein [Candidatus Nanoarchaeia archaeon]
MKNLMFALMLVILVAGCTSSAKDTNNTQIANPASVYCIEQGYNLTMRTDDNGTAGYCIFPNGSECEEWAYYHGECEPIDNTLTNVTINGNVTISVINILSDIEIASDEVNSINVNNTGDSIMPLTEEDLDS